MMTLFETTPSFLIAFSNTLIHSLWIAAIIFLFVKGVLLSVRDQKSGLRYWISSMGLLLFVAATVVLLLYMYSPSSSTSLSPDKNLRSLYLMAISANQVPVELYSLDSFYPFLWKTYLLGLLILSLRWIVSALRIRMIIKKGMLPDASSRNLMEDLKHRLGIRKNIRLILSEKLSAPVLYGFFKPVIIVPAGMIFNLSHEQVESILMHELIHVKRMDFIVNLLQTILEVLFFFNPFIWLISKQIRAEREKYCDDHVIDSGSSPKEYAKALLNLSLLGSDRIDLAVSATGKDRHILLSRIQRILNTKTMKTRNRQKIMLTYLVIVSFIVIIISSGFSTSLFTIEKNALNESILPIPELVDKTVDDLLFIPDTIKTKDVKEMTEEEWQEFKKQHEHELQEMKRIDWEKEMAEFEIQKQQMLTDIEIDKEQLEEDLAKAREDLKAIDKEKIKQELIEAQQHMDSIRENIDMEMIEEEIALAREEIKLAIQEMELDLQDTLIHAREIELALHESLAALEKINLEQIRINIEDALVDIDFDHDFDFDFDHNFNVNIDSIMKQAQISIQEIDFEAIRQNVEEAIEKMEMEIQEMEEQRRAKKEEK